MFERYTDRARRAVVLSQEEARMLNHNYIGTEHVLLGLLREAEGVAARALVQEGITLEAARQRVEEIIGLGQQAPSGHIPLTPRSKNVLGDMAIHEALQLGSNYIGTEHILLAIAQEGSGVAAQVIVSYHATMEGIRLRVLAVLSGSAPPNTFPTRRTFVEHVYRRAAGK